MLDFKALKPEDKEKLDQYLQSCGERGCEYNFCKPLSVGSAKSGDSRR